MDISKKQNGFTVVSTDESFFFFDSIVRRVWIKKDERPVVRITGSHQESVLFGSISLEGKQLFRQYDWFDENTFLDYLALLHESDISQLSSESFNQMIDITSELFIVDPETA